MKKNDLRFLLLSFLSWRTLLFVFLSVAVTFVALQESFLGGRLESYIKAPYLWSWINFDGEHYLSIVYRGYQPLTYFFFPAYPLLTRLVSSLFSQSFISLVVSGLLVSHIAFFLGLIGLLKLIRLDYSGEVARVALLMVFLFPTSFYFGSFYTESMFLALVVWSFYAARRGNFVVAGLLGAISTATRIVGLALIPALIAEAWLQYRKDRKLGLFKPVFGIMLVLVGILAYMYFLKVQTGDSLGFFHSVEIYGQQRSTDLILLPQVFYRYIFKILPNVNYDYFPIVFTTFFEFITGSALLLLSVFSFFRIRLSYAVYLAIGFIIPTLSGSFSSLPRYVLVLFPAFILTAIYLSKMKKVYRIVIFVLSSIFLGIATALFVRGYWVA